MKHVARRWQAVGRLFGALRAGLLAAALLGLASCGGVGDLAGVGSGGSGLAEGTVTGFGSVYIDGERYDDSAAVVTEEGPGGTRAATLKLGQRVRLQSTADKVAESIQVIAELVGPIEQVTADGPTALRLTVLGQTIRVDPVAAGATIAATWIDFADLPCGANCRLEVGQWIQAYGTWTLDAATNAYHLLASRVEVTDPQASVLLSGVVRQVNGGRARLNSGAGREVDLGNLQGAAAPVVDQVFRVWAAPPANAPGVQGAPVVANRSVVEPPASTANASKLVLGGEVSQVSADGVIEIQGRRISVPPELRDMFAPERFVRVEVERGPTGWSLAAPPKVGNVDERAQVQIAGNLRVGDLAKVQAGDWRLRDTALNPILLPPSCQRLLAERPDTQVRVSVQAVRGRLPMRVQSIECSIN